MRPSPVDMIVVGAGAAGLTVAAGWSRLGRRVALVEAGDVGGDCTNVGCIPSKTLIEVARRVAARPDRERPAAARDALAQARRQRDAVRAHDAAWLAEASGIELVRGRARLVAARPGRVEVDVEAPDGLRRLAARRVVLATGSVPVVPPVPGLEGADTPSSRVRTNATLFDLETPPAHLAVLGAGAIGCEMAFAFAHLGSRVTLIEAAGRVLPATEPEAAAAIRARLDAAGVRVLVGTRMAAFDPHGGRVALASTEDDGSVGRDAPPPLEHVSDVLVAVGRRAATRDLGLADVGVAVGPDGLVRVDRGYRTDAPGVYAIGDLIGGGFTHVANAQGRRLVRRLALPLPLLPEGDHPSLAFTEPEVGQVGPTLAELRRRWPAEILAVHRVALPNTDRGGTMGLRDGFVQLVALRGSGRLLAATVVAPDASEMLPLLAAAQRRGTSLWRLARLEVAYPALSEAIRIAADAFVFGSLPRLHLELAAYLRWRWAGRPTR